MAFISAFAAAAAARIGPRRTGAPLASAFSHVGGASVLVRRAHPLRACAGRRVLVAPAPHSHCLHQMEAPPPRRPGRAYPCLGTAEPAAPRAA